jgi:hypothetical protein
VDPDRSSRFSINVRIPGWTRNSPMPGGLYRFLDANGEPVTLSVNGQPVRVSLSNGFARLDRRWARGDVVDLSLPMPIRRVVADERVRDDAGRVALERGPLVYAAEWPDNGGHVLDLVVPDGARLESEYRPGLLNGVVVISGRVQAMRRTGAGAAVQGQPHRLVAVPYFAWANRGMGEMQVWLPRQPGLARVTPILPPPPIARVDSSGGIEKKWTGYNDQNDDIVAVYDGVNPLSSADESNLYFRMRPPVGQAAWIEYTFKRPTTVRSTDVYFRRRQTLLQAALIMASRLSGRRRMEARRSRHGLSGERQHVQPC